MLNSYSVTPKVDARTTNHTHNNLTFNAVSGTLCKSHPKSIFTWFQHGSQTEAYLMGANPEFCFRGKKESWHDDDGKWHYEEFKREPAVLLQMMLTGENRVLAEIVKADDFFESPMEVQDGY